MQDYSFHKNIANFPGIFTELTDSGIDFSQFTEGKLADSTAEGKIMDFLLIMVQRLWQFVRIW